MLLGVILCRCCVTIICRLSFPRASADPIAEGMKLQDKTRNYVIAVDIEVKMDSMDKDPLKYSLNIDESIDLHQLRFNGRNSLNGREIP